MHAQRTNMVISFYLGNIIITDKDVTVPKQILAKKESVIFVPRSKTYFVTLILTAYFRARVKHSIEWQ